MPPLCLSSRDDWHPLPCPELPPGYPYLCLRKRPRLQVHRPSGAPTTRSCFRGPQSACSWLREDAAFSKCDWDRPPALAATRPGACVDHPYRGSATSLWKSKKSPPCPDLV